MKDRYEAVKALFPLIPKTWFGWLDVGCGDGRLFREVAPDCRMIGMEKDPNLVARVPFRCEAVEHDFNKPWPFATEEFDLVTAISVIQYADNIEHIFKEASRVLKPDRTFIVEFPNFDFMGGFIRPSMFVMDDRIRSEFGIKDVIQTGRDWGFKEYGPFPVGRFQLLKAMFPKTLAANVIVKFQSESVK